jgi:hypothetical protein
VALEVLVLVLHLKQPLAPPDLVQALVQLHLPSAAALDLEQLPQHPHSALPLEEDLVLQLAHSALEAVVDSEALGSAAAVWTAVRVHLEVLASEALQLHLRQQLQPDLALQEDFLLLVALGVWEARQVHNNSA